MFELSQIREEDLSGISQEEWLENLINVDFGGVTRVPREIGPKVNN